MWGASIGKEKQLLTKKIDRKLSNVVLNFVLFFNIQSMNHSPSNTGRKICFSNHYCDKLTTALPPLNRGKI